MPDLSQYSQNAADNNAAVPDGFPENWTGSQINDALRTFAASVREWYDGPEWLELTYDLAPRGAKTLSRVSDTTIRIVGTDATAKFPAGRAVRIVGATTETGFVSSSTLNGSDTDVVVTFAGSTVMPTTPTEIRAFFSTHLGGAAFKDEGSGNGLDADTVDGRHAADLAATRNWTINGDFWVWQRGASFVGIAAAQYTADRWRYDPNSGTATILRSAFTLGQTDVPREPRYHATISQTAAAGAPVLEQRLENVSTLAGQEITISFYAKALASMNITPSVVQHFGTGGSPSPDVVTGGAVAAVTTSWQRFTATITVPSISGSTLGTDLNDYLAIRFSMPAAASFALDIADVQVEQGGTASDFVREGFDDQLRKCLRFYQKTFDYGVAPAQSTGSTVGALAMQSTGVANGGGAEGRTTPVVMWQFSQPMRATPILTTFNYNNANSNFRSSVGTEVSVSTSTGGTRSATFNGSTHYTNQHTIYLHATAEAEL